MADSHHPLPSTAAQPVSLSPTVNLDYHDIVLKLVSRMTRSSNTIDQNLLRFFISLSPSYIIHDATTKSSAGEGIQNWSLGFHRLVDILLALHAQGVLELETVNEASKACSEVWSVTGCWTECSGGREGVRGVASRLKSILDPDGQSYGGRKVYVP